MLFNEKGVIMVSFKDFYLRGEATREMMDDLVDEWHKQIIDSKSLVEFLGFDTLEEYENALKDKNLL